METRPREGIGVLNTWTILLLILHFPVAIPGVNEFYIQQRLFEEDLVPSVVYYEILPTDYDCKDEDDLSSVLEVTGKRNLKRYDWKVYISPFFVRQNRLLNLNGNYKRMPFDHVDPLLHRNIETVFWGVIFIYPFFVIFAFILVVIFSRLGGEMFHAMFIYGSHPKFRGCLRRMAINRQKRLRQWEIDYTPDYSKIERKYRLFFPFRTTSDDSEPDELKDFDFNLLVSNKRIILDPPMPIKFGYYFEKKNLCLDPITNMIVPLPEPEDTYALTFEELQMIKAEQILLDKKTLEVGEDRKKYSQARRLIYNIPKARFFAIQQGLPYLADVNRREIMLQVKKARKERRRQEAAATDVVYPSSRRKAKSIDWTRTPKLLRAHRKSTRKKPRPTVLPPDEPNSRVRRGKHYSPVRFNPKIRGGGVLMENEWKDRRYRRKLAKKYEYHLSPAELEKIKKQVEEETKRAEAHDKEAREAYAKERAAAEARNQASTAAIGPTSPASATATNVTAESSSVTASGTTVANSKDVFVFADADDELNKADGDLAKNKNK